MGSSSVMKRKLISSLSFILIISSTLYAHCQVPCGIYDDALRIVQIKENITTIWKAMKQINELSGKGSDAQTMNQLVRWINTKEEHAKHVQTIVSDYFLAQRIKPKEKEKPGRQNYVNQTLILHQIIVAAMKCKQTTDPASCDTLSNLIETFSNSYFDEHGLEHLQEIEKSE